MNRFRALQNCPRRVRQLMFGKLLVSSSSRELFDLPFEKKMPSTQTIILERYSQNTHTFILYEPPVKFWSHLRIQTIIRSRNFHNKLFSLKPVSVKNSNSKFSLILIFRENHSILLKNIAKMQYLDSNNKGPS